MRPFKVRLYNPVLFSAVGGAQKYTATVAQYLADAWRDLDIGLVAYSVKDADPAEARELLNRRYALNLPSVIGVETIDKWGAGAMSTLRAHRALRATSKGVDLYLNCFHNVHWFDARKNVHLVHFPARRRTEASPRFSRNAVLRAVGAVLDRRYRESYDLFICNSRFTEGWLERYWGIEETRRSVLYPPVEPARGGSAFDPAAKEKLVLLVSRFDRRKNLKEAVARFARDAARFRGWELAVAGGCGPDEEEYRREIEEIARGSPVSIFANPDKPSLDALYGRASIFWHAMGFGVDEAKNPIDVEHFGISTVEAMAAGAVPVAIDKGGQREIVDHGSNGFRWRSLEELSDLTALLVGDEALRHRLARAARAKSDSYSLESFYASIDSLFRDRQLIPQEYHR